LASGRIHRADSDQIRAEDPRRPPRLVIGERDGELFGVFWGAKKRGTDPKKFRRTPETVPRSENVKLIFGIRDQMLIIELEYVPSTCSDAAAQSVGENEDHLASPECSQH